MTPVEENNQPQELSPQDRVDIAKRAVQEVIDKYRVSIRSEFTVEPLGEAVLVKRTPKLHFEAL